MPITTPVGTLDFVNARIGAAEIRATSNIGVANTAPTKTFSVGDKFHVDNDSTDPVSITGNVVASGIKISNLTISPAFDFASVSNVGNVTANVIQFANATTGFTTTANVEIGGNISLTSNAQVTIGSNVLAEYTGPHGREPKEVPLKKYPEIAFEEGKFDGNDTTNTYTQAGYTVTADSQITACKAYKAFDNKFFVNGSDLNRWQTGNHGYYGSTADTTTGPVTTLADSTTKRGSYIQLESPHKIIVSRYVIWAQEDSDTFRPKKVILLGSNTGGTDWVSIDPAGEVEPEFVSTGTFPASTMATVSFTNTTAYKYHRLVVRANNGGIVVLVQELELYGREEPAPVGDLSLDTTIKSTFNSVRSNNYVMYFDGEDPDTGNVPKYLPSGTVKTITPNNITFDATNNCWSLDGSTESNVTTGDLGFEGDVPHTVSMWVNSSNLEANALTQQLFTIGSGYDKSFLKVDDTQIAANTWHNLTYAYQGEGGSKVTYVDGRKVEEAQVEDTFGEYPPFAMDDLETGGYRVSTNGYVDATIPNALPKYAFDKRIDNFFGFGRIVDARNDLPGTVDGSALPSGYWLKLELPHKLRVNSYNITPRGDTSQPSSSPLTWKVYGSNDDNTWTLLHEKTDSTPINPRVSTTDNPGSTFAVSTVGSFKYLALIVLTNAGFSYLNLGELRYYGHKEGDLTRFPEPTRVLKYPHIAMTGPAQRGYVASTNNKTTGTSGVPYRDAFMAYDGIFGSQNATWQTQVNSYDSNGDDVSGDTFTVGGTNYIGHWNKLQLPNPIKVDKIEIIAYVNGTNDQRPDQGAFLGSTDGTNWELIYSFSSGTLSSWSASGDASGIRQITTITGITNTNKYNYLTLVVEKIPSSSTATQLGVAEIRYFGTEEDTGTPAIVGGPFAGKVANFRVYDKYLGDERIQEIYDAQKDAFGHKKSSMTFYKGRIGVGTTEPEGALTVLDEPHAMTKFPERAISSNESYDEGTGQIKLSAADGSGYRAFDGLTSTSWDASPERHTRLSEEVDFGAWLKIQTPESMSLKKAEFESNPDWRQVGDTINDSAEHVANSSSFGIALDCTDDGTRIIVGAPSADPGSNSNRGQAFVFDWNGSGWVRVGNVFEGTQNGEQLGYAVAISGDGKYVAVGSNLYHDGSTADVGRYAVFYLDGSTWTLVPDSGPLTSTLQNYFLGTATNDRAGWSLSLSHDGKTIAAGYRQLVSGAGGEAGQIRVHTYANGAWTQKGQNLNGLESGDRLGESVKITPDGNHLIAGANYGSVSAVYVYDYNSSSSLWVKRTTLTHPTSPSTDTHTFGAGIAISDDGNTVAVGAPGDDGSGTNWGRVYVFTWSGSVWTLVSTLVSPLQGTDNEKFGTAVDLSGDGTRLVAAAPNENNEQGYAFTYEYTGGMWQLRNYSTSGSAGVSTDGRLGDFYTSLIISRDGSTIVGGDRAGNEAKVRVWNMPSNIKSIWGSNDDTNWTKITTGNETFRVDDRLEFKNLDNPNYYKYHAIVADAFTRLKDVKLFGVRKQGSSTLHDGALTLTKNLDVPRIGPPPDADDTPRRDRLVVEYNTHINPLEDGVVRDTSGRGNDGAFYGDARYDVTEKALVFDGNGDNISGIIPNISGEYVHSITLWVKIVNSGQVYTVFEMGARSQDDLIGVSITSSGINYYFYGNDSSYNLNISSGTWYHLTFTYSGGSDLSNRKVYVNGNEISRSSHGGASTGALTLASGSFTIGDIVGGTGSNDLNGSISNFKLYDCALTAQEVKTLYDMGRCSNAIPKTLHIMGGMMRYNNDINRLQIHNGLGWITIGGISAVGGTVEYINEYTVHTFTSSDTFTVTSGGEMEYLVVAGGGGSSAGYYSGGGGAGGMLTGTTTINTGSYAITRGSGGAVDANGTSSSIGSLVSTTGGGKGGANGNAGSNGGSGGGGAYVGGGSPGTGALGGTGVSGPPRQGYNGGRGNGQNGYGWGGGGGGAGGNGFQAISTTQPGHGGVGLQSSISGTSRYYAGGGGGNIDSSGYNANGGLGGGGNGSQGGGNAAGTNGEENTGGGGGNKRAGGSGIVIIRYLT